MISTTYEREAAVRGVLTLVDVGNHGYPNGSKNHRRDFSMVFRRTQDSCGII